MEPTPNNPQSSRSHVVVCVTGQPRDSKNKAFNLIICDLAGAENKFVCEGKRGISDIEKFFNIYAPKTDELKQRYQTYAMKFGPLNFNNYECLVKSSSDLQETT